MSVAYLDGSPARSLGVEFTDGVLTLDGGDQRTRFSGYQNVELAPALDAEKRIFGIRVDLQTGPDKHTVIVARFGGTPFSGRSAF